MKRILSFLLCLCLCMAPLPVFAAVADTAWDGTVDISWYDPTQSEYYLSTPAQLAGLAALVNGMTDPTCPKTIGDASYLESISVENFTLVGAGGGNVSDTVYTSRVDFAYKTVYLTADMDMGGKYDAASGTWSGPNWTPVGGKFPMLPDETAGDCLTLDTRFNGVLDGQGHSITNLYCDRYAAKGFPYSMAIGVVGYLGGTGGVNNYSGDVTQFENGWRPGVRNLVLASGSIRGRRMVGGIVGRVDETNNGVFIENCANHASVTSTDAKGVGGIVGSGWGKGVVRGCYNAGAISTTYSSPAGGIVGTVGGMDVYCCYSRGPIDTNGQRHGRAIGSHDSGSYTVANCVYLDGSGDDPENPGFYVGTSKRITVSVTGMTAEELKSGAALAILNTDGAVFAPDVNGVNDGYPVLWFQNTASSGECKLTIAQPAGGTVSMDGGGTARYGQTVRLSAEPAPGYILSRFTVNGAPIGGEYFTVTGDAVISAVFKTVRLVTLTLPESADFYVAVAGEDGQKRSGDTLREGETLKVLAYGYPDAVPEDMDLEYVDAFEITLSGASKNPDGSYTVTGESDVTAQVSRRTQRKAWINLADTAWYDSDPRLGEYNITTAEQLAGLALLVNRRGVDFAGVTIRLGNDISLDNTDGTAGARLWTPIGGNAAKAFRGHFDGQGFAVYDLTISAAASYAALFGCCENAVIENLSVYGCVESSAAAAYAAGVAAYMTGGSIRNCSNYAGISAAGTHAAGIAAMLREGAAVEGCLNYGTVTASSGLGGLVGVSDGGGDVIRDSANFGVVCSTGNATYGCGGLAGRLAGTVSGCVNYAEISGTDRYTGGLVGYTTAKNHSAILNSANRGAVSSGNTTATAALGGLVGYAQFLSLGGSENTGEVTPGKDFATEYVGQEIGREGTVKALDADGTIPDYDPVPARAFDRNEKSAYTVRFVADGALIAETSYTPGGAVGAVPAVPEKTGYTGAWAPYTLGEKDLTVHAVYRPRLVMGGDTITEDGTYFIAWFSSGVIAVADGVRATISGVNGGEDGFDNLALTVGKGASLALEDTILNGETALLSLAGRNTLTLRGTSELISRAEKDGAPALAAAGDLTVDGDGEIYITAGLRNPAIALSAGSTMELRSGRVSVFKDTLLGVEGGAVQAQGAAILVSGGELYGHTDNDNVAVVAADTLHVKSGSVAAQAEKCPLAIQAAVSAEGGTLVASGHTGNYTTDDVGYIGADACASYSGSVNFSDFLPFTDVFAADRYYDAVRWCWENGVFQGVGLDSFAPDASMTRAMFVTVLHRMAGKPVPQEEASFTDLTQDWYRDAVAWAVENGVALGTSDTAFSPDEPVTREQAAVFLFRYDRLTGEQNALHSADYHGSVGPIHSWAEAEVRWALNTRLFDGAKAPMASPGSPAPRALLATALYNYARSVQ